MEAGLLVLLSATVARGLLASAFALVNERRLCSSRASTSGSSRCRTDDLLHAPRGPARRGIESSPARAASITCAWSRRGSRSRCPVRSLAWAGGRSSPSRSCLLHRRTDRRRRTRAPKRPLRAASRASLKLLPFEDRSASIRVDGLWGMYQWLDRAPKGRNEAGVWWRRHDEYDKR